jgi:SAM-dependent methyltransferase
VKGSTQKKDAEAAFWDKVARERIYAAFDKEEYENYIDTLGADLTGKTIVDIGSAAGVSAALFAARGATVYGIDISPELIAQAKTLWPEYQDRLHFQVGDAEKLELKDASVDGCFFGGVLHHFPDRDGVYAEAARILKPGGRFIAVEPNRLDFLELIEWGVAELRGKLSPNEYPIDPFSMKTEMQTHGFSPVRFWTVRHDIPFLGQLPLLRMAFSRQKGFWFKRPLLRLIDAFRAPEKRGTFFVIDGVKADG